MIYGSNIEQNRERKKSESANDNKKISFKAFNNMNEDLSLFPCTLFVCVLRAPVP